MWIWHWIIKGGYVMWPILACSIASVAIFFERWQRYDKVKLSIEEEVIAPAKGRYTLEEKKEILQSGGQRLIGDMQQYVQLLEVIVTISPLLGLLGTVTGMISSFNVLSVQTGEPFAITGGVSEALIATATGLCVAIVALCLHTALIQKQNKIIQKMTVECDAFLRASMGGTHGV